MNYLHRTWAEIDIEALKHNFEIIKNTANGKKIMAVVKANAYGHSVADVAPVLENGGADFFAVSNISEALQLREIGIKKPVLILGYTPTSLAKQLSDNNISQCVYSREYAAELSKEAMASSSTVKIHIKIDSGMSRLGFDCRNKDLNGIDDAVFSAKLDGLSLEGIFTHFAVSDRLETDDDGFTDAQYKRFCAAIAEFEKNGLNPEIRHCCNSAAIIKDSDKHFDLCRPGIILYGLMPTVSAEFDKNFIPVMTLKSIVSMVKEINEGDTVSYGRTFTAERKIKVATVSAGYADGYPRALSNKAYVIINGKKAKILGKVCMDQMIVDVSDIDDVKMGDEVILFGSELPVDILADMANTISYEIVCGISPRVPRIIKGVEK